VTPVAYMPDRYGVDLQDRVEPLPRQLWPSSASSTQFIGSVVMASRTVRRAAYDLSAEKMGTLPSPSLTDPDVQISRIRFERFARGGVAMEDLD